MWSTALLILSVRLASAAGLFDPATMLDVDQIRPGMTGYGKTVFEGTRIETFRITVIGVLKRIDAGGDAVLVRVDDGPVVTKGYGIVAGMSGSPIYINNKLVGAIAFGWSFTKEPIGGVTPIRQMLEAYEPSTGGSTSTQTASTYKSRYGPIRLASRRFDTVQLQPSRIASGQAAIAGTVVMHPVATPLIVHGLSPAGMRQLERALEPFINVVPVAGPGGQGPLVKTPLAPGSAVGAQLMTGDMDFTAIGTVTYVSGDRVVAFGHTFLGLGPLQAPMTTAYIHGILPSSQFSFKLGSPGVPVGAVTEDRTWCIGGKLGKRPDLIEALYQVTDKDRGVQRRMGFEVIREKLLSPILLMMSYAEMMNNVIAPMREGTTEMKLNVKPQGLPEITRENVFSTGPTNGTFGMSSGPEGELMNALDLLTNNRFKQVGIERVRMDTTFTSKRSSAVVEKVIVNKTHVKPGDAVTLLVHLRPFEQSVTVRELQIPIPMNTRSGPLRVAVAGGEMAERIRFAFGLRPPVSQSIEQEIQLYEGQYRNDRIVALMTMPAVGLEMRGCRLPALPLPYLEMFRGTGSGTVRMIRDGNAIEFPSDSSINGLGFVTLMVEAEEPEKSGASFAPGGEGSGGEEGGPDYYELERMGMTGSEGEASSPLKRWFRASARPQAHGDPLAGTYLKKDEPLRKEEVDTTSPAKMPSWEEVEDVGEDSGEDTNGSDTSGGKSHKTKSLARPPVVWVQSTQKDFVKGKCDRTAVQSDGRVILSPSIQVQYSNAQAYPMCQATDGAGNLFIGTWLDPKVIKLDPAGKASVLFDTPTGAAITAIAFIDGFVYAAESPTGIIYKIASDGSRFDKWSTLYEQFIWSIASGSSGSIIVGTGSDGRIYRIDAAGKATVLFQVPDRHVLALARNHQGQLHALTYPRGKVYRLDNAGKAATVFESPKLSALSLAFDGKDNLYIGTSPRGSVIRVAPDGSIKEVCKFKERHVLALVSASDGRLYAGTGPKGNLYRVSDGGDSAAILPSPDNFITSLVPSSSGQVYATSVNANRVLSIGSAPEQVGLYTSSVRDAETPARWGRIAWDTDALEGSSVTLQTRSGNTAYPDKAWSDWSNPYGNSAGDVISSPGARYIQYRATLYPGKGQVSPALRRVALLYMTKNRPPEVQLKSPAVGDHVSGKLQLRWSSKDPDKDKLKFQVSYSADAGKTWVEIVEEKKSAKPEASENETPAGTAGEDTKPTDEPKAGKDEGRDEQPERPSAHGGDDQGETPGAPPEAGGDEGKGGPAGAPPEFGGMERDTAAGDELLKDEVMEMPEEASFDSGAKQSRAWDTTKVPDGIYIVKVVASDEIANPRDALQDEVISGAFVVDNGKPDVKLPEPFKETPKDTVKLTCSDTASRIASADYRIDSGDWIAAAAADGIFDSLTEEIEIKPENITAGKHSLHVRARDAAGNETEVELKYETPAPPGQPTEVKDEGKKEEKKPATGKSKPKPAKPKSPEKPATTDHQESGKA